MRSSPRSDFDAGFGLGRRPFGDVAVRGAIVAPHCGPGLAPRWEAHAKWLETKPPFGDWFNKCETITLAASAQLTPITGFRIPAHCLGVLRFLANATANASDSASVKFALLIDNSPKPGYANILGPLSPGINTPIPMMDPLDPGQIVVVAATNLTTSAIAGVAAYIRGWYWPMGN